MKKLLFVDRDGTIIAEPPGDYQVDAFEKLEFIPGAIGALSKLAAKQEFEMVMVTNQDGLGTDAFPEWQFQGPHDMMNEILLGEGIRWREEIIDRTYAHEGAETRKPGIGLVGHYLTGEFDLTGSYVIGDRLTDMLFAKNMGCKGILLGKSVDTTDDYLADGVDLTATIVARCSSWADIMDFLESQGRSTVIERKTKETIVRVSLNLDGRGQTNIATGLNFFDHMLDQIGKHSGVDLAIAVEGDLEIDEHHTIEDTALTLGQAFLQALGNKRGTERYGYALPMDEACAEVLLDFGGRPWLVWEADFQREYVGDMPTEMFMHFFKSFSDAALCNLQIRCRGKNEHHKIESIFKGLARAIKRAIRRDMDSFDLPSTKGTL